MNETNGKLHLALSPEQEVERDKEMIKACMRQCIERERKGSNAAMIKVMEEVAEELGCSVLDIKVAMMSQSLVPLFKMFGIV